MTFLFYFSAHLRPGTQESIFYRGKSKQLLTGRSTDVLYSSKGGLISEFFSFWLKSQKKRCQITNYQLYNFQKMLVVVIWHLFFRDLSQLPSQSVSIFLVFKIMFATLKYVGPKYGVQKNNQEEATLYYFKFQTLKNFRST